MFLTLELDISRVDVSMNSHGILKPSKHLIRAREIALHAEYVVCCIAKAPPQSQISLFHGQRVLVVSFIV